MSPPARVWVLAICAGTLVAGATGEAASNWRVYKLPDGLAESACLAVSFGQHGRVLARHYNLPALSELNGYQVSVLPAPSGSGRIYASAGGQLWAAVPEGLQEFSGKNWTLHRSPEISAVFQKGTARVLDPIPLQPVRLGVTLVLLPDRLAEFNVADSGRPRLATLRLAGSTGLGSFTGLAPARDGGLWVAGRRGLAKIPGPVRAIRAETVWAETILPESAAWENLREPQESQPGRVTAIADTVSATPEKILVTLRDGQWHPESIAPERIRHAWVGPDEGCWASSIDALFRGTNWATMTENEEAAARQYFDVATEPGGAFWLATSDGLFRFAPLPWRPPAEMSQITSAVNCMAMDAENVVWVGTATALHSLKDGAYRRHPYPPRLPLSPGPEALYGLRDGGLALQAGERLFYFRPATGNFQEIRLPPSSGLRGAPVRALGPSGDGRLCVQVLSPATSNRLYACTGPGLENYLDDLPALSEDGACLAAFGTRNGDLWLSGTRGTACWRDKKWQTYLSVDRSAPEGAVAFVEMPEGRLWCATPDQVWEFDGRSWTMLRQGFDRIAGMVPGRDGSVWLASNSGVLRAARDAWLENNTEEGLPTGNIRCVLEDSRGRVWAGTTRGLSLYHPETDVDPPRTSIRPLPEKDNQVPDGVPVTIAFRATDKWKYTASDRLAYSFRLDKSEWSEYQERDSVPLLDLSPGKHYFQVKAIDRSGNIETVPAQLDFTVVLPWYRETRLVAISLAGLAAALFFAGVAFNRHRQLLRSYAAVEQTIAERTRQLERANRELLQSQKMTALGTLAAGIAHDFNNILSIIKGSAQLIEDNLDKPEKIRTRVDRINTVVEQGAGIVKAMLGFSRDSDRAAEDCDVNAVVRDTIKLLGDRFLREMRLSFEPAEGLPQVRLTRDFVQQILLNFLFNAADATASALAKPGGGDTSQRAQPEPSRRAARQEIVLKTSRLERLPPSLALSPANAPDYVAILVRDFGCGIAPEVMPRIFEPFFTTKALSTRRGTGLGLSMAYELARKLGAGIAVDSVVDEGTTFALILPVRTNGKVEPASEARAHESASTPS